MPVQASQLAPHGQGDNCRRLLRLLRCVAVVVRKKVSACGRVALVPGVVIGRDQVYDDMRSHGIAPNVDVFSALVMTAIRAKSMELGREAVLLMEQEGVAKNEKIYSLLVHLAAISNDVRAHTLRGVARDGRGSTLPVLSRSRALRRQ